MHRTADAVGAEEVAAAKPTYRVLTLQTGSPLLLTDLGTGWLRPSLPVITTFSPTNATTSTFVNTSAYTEVETQ